MHELIGLGLLAAGVSAYAAYKHVTLAQVKAEVKKIEAEAVADVRDVIDRIKVVLYSK